MIGTANWPRDTANLPQPKQVEAWAQRVEPDANRGVGAIQGNGVNQCFKEAAKWTTKAAEQGLAEALYEMARAWPSPSSRRPCDHQGCSPGPRQGTVRPRLLLPQGEGVDQSFEQAAE